MIIFLKKDGNKLVPDSPAEMDKVAKLKNDVVLTCDVKLSRNALFHRKFFAFVRFCFDNVPEQYMEQIKNRRNMLDFIKIGAGHATMMITPKGDRAYIPESISWAAMDETTFGEFYSNAVDFACKYLLIGIDPETIERELIRYI